MSVWFCHVTVIDKTAAAGMPAHAGDRVAQ